MNDRAIRQYLESGAPPALAEMIRETRGLVLNVAYQVARNRADAEDIAQEVFLGLAQSRPARLPRNPRAWLAWKAIGLARNWVRSQRRRRKAERQGASLNMKRKRETPEFDGATMVAIAKAVDSLPENLRLVVYLRYFREFRIDEIGRATGCRRATVRYRLRKARSILSKRIPSSTLALLLSGVLAVRDGEAASWPFEISVSPRLEQALVSLLGSGRTRVLRPSAPMIERVVLGVLGLAGMLVVVLLAATAFPTLLEKTSKPDSSMAETGSDAPHVRATPAPPSLRPTKLSPDSRGAMPGDSIAGIPSPSFLIRVVSSRTLYPIDGSLVRGEDIDGRELFRATTSPSGLVAIPLRLVHGALSGEPQRARAGHEMSLRLSAKADGHADSCVSVPMASLAAAETYQLALHPALLVEGVVEGAHGEPLGSAGVVGEWYGKDGLRGYGGVSETDTQPDGTFSLPLGETVRKARLLAFRPDFAPAIVSLDFRGRSIPPVRIVLDEPGLVSGWVYSLAGKPMPSACVRLRSARLEWGNGALLERLLNAFGNRCVDRAWTDAFGAFRIEGIGCGTYSVTCQLDGWELSGHPIDLVVPAATECLVLLRPCPEAHPLIPPDIDEAALPATLSVRLRRGDGLLAAGTLCCAVRNAFGETDCSTARIRAGRAAIEVPATGFFDAVFSVEGFRPVSQMGLRSQDFREGALDIDLDVGIRVQGMLSVNGTRGGLLRPGILSLMDPETRLALQVARFDREGRFSLEHVEPRPYVAEVRMGAGLFAVTDVFEIRDGEVLISAEDSSEEVGLNP